MSGYPEGSDPLPYVLSWLGNQPLACAQPSEESMRALLERADQEGVGGIVAQVLQHRLSVRYDWLQTMIYGWFCGGAEHFGVLEALAEPLAQRGLKLIALKGVALAPTVYQGQLSSRPVSDLDLLVCSEEEQALKELAAEVIEDLQARVTIDWHHDLTDSHRIPCRALLLRLKPGELWALSSPWKGGIRHLTPELQFIHLALHAFKHSCCRLIWLVDQALVLRTCHLPTLLELARRVGAERPVLVALNLLGKLLREQAPSSRLGWHEKVALWLACRRGSTLGWGELFLVFSVEGMANKLRYFFQYLFPGTEVLGEEGRNHRLQASFRRIRRFFTNKNRNLG